MSANAAVPSAPVALRSGDELPVATIGPLTRTDFVRYAGAGGDLNPIHHDEPMAQAAGMPSVFGMGMLHAGMLGMRLARWVGPDSLRSYRVRFSGQVWPGDELTLSGRVLAIEPADGDADDADDADRTALARIELRVVSQRGDEVLRAEATATVAA